MKKIIILILLSLCVNLYAMDINTSIDLGYGNVGTVSSIEFGVSMNNFLLSIDSMYNFEQELIGGGIPKENKWENSFLVGYAIDFDFSTIEIKSGIGVVYYKERYGEFISVIDSMTAK